MPSSRQQPVDSDLTRRVRGALAGGGYSGRGARLIVGVSGGPDSTALLASLVELREDCRLEMHVVHVDHRLRPEARDDARYVKRLCARWNVPVTIRREDVPEIRREEGLSTEAAARAARHRVLLEEAAAFQADAITLGHTRDDDVETMLLNLLRGAGLRGMAGMAGHAESPFTDHSGRRWPIIRPLLGVSRVEALDYLRSRRLKPRHDPSNMDPAHLRNRVRHELLPLMEQIREGAADALGRVSDDARDALDYLESKADPVWQTACAPAPDGRSVRINRTALREAHIALRHIVLERCIIALLGSTQGVSRRNYVDIDNMVTVGRTGSRIDLPKGLRLHCLSKNEALLWHQQGQQRAGAA